MALLIRNRRLIVTAFSLWTFWILFYSWIMSLQEGMSYLIALFSSATVNYLYALMGIPIWFIARFIRMGRYHSALFFGVHFFIAIVITSFWLGCYLGLWTLIFGPEILNVIHVRRFIGWQFLAGMQNYFFIAGFYYSYIHYKNYRQKELDAAELRSLSRDAELKALKLQMNPHFLFNALNSIHALIPTQPEIARRMLIRLSGLLHLSLKTREQFVIPLREELQLAEYYLEIENIRFADKMHIVKTIDESILDTPFPALFLQPLLENAVKHGISNSRHGGEIQIHLHRRGEAIEGEISNPLTAVSSSPEDSIEKAGIGLSNIQQRLHLLYGDRSQLSFRKMTDKFEVRFKIPLNLPGTSQTKVN